MQLNISAVVYHVDSTLYYAVCTFPLLPNINLGENHISTQKLCTAAHAPTDLNGLHEIFFVVKKVHISNIHSYPEVVFQRFDLWKCYFWRGKCLWFSRNWWKGWQDLKKRCASYTTQADDWYLDLLIDLHEPFGLPTLALLALLDRYDVTFTNLYCL